MTLASDPFGMIAGAAQQARSAPARGAVTEIWRNLSRLCAAVVPRREAGPRTMAEASWQTGFAAMWDQSADIADNDTSGAQGFAGAGNR